MTIIEDWIKQEQGKHFCKCGCGIEIIINREHYTLGIPNYAPKTRKNKENKIGRISNRLGIKHSKETRKKISESQKGTKNHNYGRHHSREHILKISGNNHPNWKGGTSFEPYCHKFNNRLKDRIRDRDNRTCQGCGIKENGSKLSIHHIHYDKENCYPDLIAVCRACNTKANHNREYWEEYYMNILETRGLLNWS